MQSRRRKSNSLKLPSKKLDVNPHRSQHTRARISLHCVKGVRFFFLVGLSNVLKRLNVTRSESGGWRNERRCVRAEIKHPAPFKVNWNKTVGTGWIYQRELRERTDAYVKIVRTSTRRRTLSGASPATAFRISFVRFWSLPTAATAAGQECHFIPRSSYRPAWNVLLSNVRRVRMKWCDSLWSFPTVILINRSRTHRILCNARARE